MDKQSERVRWIESLRAFALLMVVIPHFIASFCPEVFNVWETHSLFLKGISGKHGVAIFCVLLGFFSSKSSKNSFPTYIVRRYLQFAINISIVLLVYSIVCAILSHMNFVGFVRCIVNSLFESVLLMSGLNPTLWCVRDLFFGSLICFVFGNYCKMENKWGELGFLVAFGLFMYFVDVWIAICIAGAGLRVFLKIDFSDKIKKLLCVLFVVAIPLLYRHEESLLTYAMQGLSCCLFMYVCMYVCSYRIYTKNSWLKMRLLPFLGNISFYMFLWHTPINRVLKSLDLSWNMWVLFGVSFAVSLLLSTAQYWADKIWISTFIKRVQFNTKIK